MIKVINKICEMCGESFESKNTTTRFCSHKCSQRAYKKRLKEEKVADSEKKYLSQIKGFDIVEIQKKDYLSIRETMHILNISRMTIYRMIQDGRLTKLSGLKSVRIRRSDIDELFAKKEVEKVKEEEEYKLPIFTEENYFTINEALAHTGMSSGAFYNLCKRNNIPKIPKGKNMYVPKDLINKIFQL